MSIDCVLCLTAWVRCVTVVVMIYLIGSLLLIAYVGVWILGDRAAKRAVENLARHALPKRHPLPDPPGKSAGWTTTAFGTLVPPPQPTVVEVPRASFGKPASRAEWLTRLDADVTACDSDKLPAAAAARFEDSLWAPSPKPRDTERNIPIQTVGGWRRTPRPVDQTAPTEPRMPTGRIIIEGIPAAPPVTPRRLTMPILDTSTNEPEDMFRLPSRALYEVIVDDKAAVDGVAELSRFDTAVDAEEIAALVRRLTPDGMVTIRRIA